MTITIRCGASTDVGLVRQANEDAWHASPPVFVVADGMGGHQGGDVASGCVVDAFRALRVPRSVTPQEGAHLVGAALAGAQDAIRRYSQTQQLGGDSAWYAGSTAVAALLVEATAGPAWLVANVGDSRGYSLSAHGLVQVTVDHSLVQELLDSGAIAPEEVATHPERNVVTRALGGPTLVEADFFLVPLADCERLLLCTDGVSGLIDAQQITDLLADAADPQAAADALVGAALAAGGHDNATALVLQTR